jgi:hypothetical protein
MPATNLSACYFFKMVQGGGFEPPKLARQIYSLIPLATRVPLQALINHNDSSLIRLFGLGLFITFAHAAYVIWSWREESNPRPADYKSAALPTELHQQTACIQEQTLPSRSGAIVLWRRDSRESFYQKQYLYKDFVVVVVG